MVDPVVQYQISVVSGNPSVHQRFGMDEGEIAVQAVRQQRAYRLEVSFGRDVFAPGTINGNIEFVVSLQRGDRVEQCDLRYAAAALQHVAAAGHEIAVLGQRRSESRVVGRDYGRNVDLFGTIVVPHAVRNQEVDSPREHVHRHPVEHQRIHVGLERTVHLGAYHRTVVEVGGRADLLVPVPAVTVVEDVIGQRNL